jgi:hypothetical protein
MERWRDPMTLLRSTFAALPEVEALGVFGSAARATLGLE